MTLGLFFQISLSTLLILSGMAKLMNLNSFKKTLKEIEIQPQYVNVFAILVPVCEIVISAFLMFESTSFWGQVSLLFLICTFLWATYKGMSKNLKCNCFGDLLEENFGWSLVVRILVMFAMTVYLILFEVNSANVIHAPLIDLLSGILITIGILLMNNLIQTFHLYVKGKSG